VLSMKSLLHDYPLILAEAAITERLRRMREITLHPTLFNSPLIYDEQGRETMRNLYLQYVSVARNANLPLLLAAPTWRMDRTRVAAGNVPASINTDAVSFMQEIRSSAMQINDINPIMVGGLIGPKNDCYQPSEALGADEAKSFHAHQIDELTLTNIDYILAQTMPSIHESLGMAMALATSEIPYIISFCIDRTGQVLDGTSLKEAISFIDGQVRRLPLGYMVNCAYPTFLCPETQPVEVYSRLIGYQANASSMDASDLEGADVTHEDSVEDWGDQMIQMNRQYGVSILGGCCGTTDRHLKYIADRALPIAH
jgi:homocysteine S-methyltransferase